MEGVWQACHMCTFSRMSAIFKKNVCLFFNGKVPGIPGEDHLNFGPVYGALH